MGCSKIRVQNPIPPSAMLEFNFIPLQLIQLKPYFMPYSIKLSDSMVFSHMLLSLNLFLLILFICPSLLRWFFLISFLFLETVVEHDSWITVYSSSIVYFFPNRLLLGPASVNKFLAFSWTSFSNLLLPTFTFLIYEILRYISEKDSLGRVWREQVFS